MDASREFGCTESNAWEIRPASWAWEGDEARRPVEKSVGRRVKGEEKNGGYTERQERKRRSRPRRRLGEVVGCIVGNGNSRDTKSTVQLANFPSRRRFNVAGTARNRSRDIRAARNLRRGGNDFSLFFLKIPSRMYKLTRPCALRECARVTFSLGVNAYGRMCVCQHMGIHWEKFTGLVGLNSNSGGKWTNRKFLVKSTGSLVEITRILIDIIILKIRILVDLIRNIVSTRIPVVSTKILIITRKFWFVHFQSEIFSSERTFCWSI